MFQRRRMKRSLTDAQLHSVFSIGNWKYHLLQNGLWCSEEMRGLIGLNQHENVSSYALARMVHPDDRALVLHCWRQIVSGRLVGGITFRLVTKGTERFLYAPIQREFADGELTEVYGTIRDVTPLMNHITASDWQTLAFHSDVEDAPPAVFLDRDLRVVKMTPAAEELFGWREAEVLYQQLATIPSLYRDAMRCIYQKLLHEGGMVRFDTLRITKGGRPIHVGVLLEPVRNPAGKTIGIAVLYTDTFTKDYGERLLFEVEQQTKALFEDSTNVCLILSLNQSMRYVSPAVKTVFGYTPEEYRDLERKDRIHPEDIDKFESAFEDLTNHPQENLTLQLRHRDKEGNWRVCSARLRFLSQYSGINGFIVHLNDITETIQAQEFIRHYAYYDSTTGLPNRRLFEERFAGIVKVQTEQQGKLVLFRIQINRLKYIKNSLGTAEVDEVMKVIANRLRNVAPDGSLVAKTAEDEFTMLLAVDEESVHQDYQKYFLLAHKITRLFETPFAVGDYQVHMTCAIGISRFPDDGEETVELIRAADIACQEAQEQGKNQVQIHTSSLNARTFKEISLVNDFQQALQNENFLIYYQPRMDTQTECVAGAEALLRWDHPVWGILSPVEFLHLAEETGTMVMLGEWVLRRVCQQIKDWERQGCTSICVSVNLSAQQLMEKELVPSVRNILTVYEVNPAQLEIEITETSILPNDPVIIQSIKSLRQMGIKVYFDDFGTGYSSLSWLYQFELDGIKLDKVFIDAVAEQPVPAEIVESIIKLAHGLQLEVIAEGVETTRQFQFLKEKHCDQVQGYLFSRPIPPEEFVAFQTSGALALYAADGQDVAPSGSRASYEGMLRDTDGMDNVGPAGRGVTAGRGLSVLSDKTPRGHFSENRRHHFRVHLPHPLVGQVTIERLKDKRVNIDYSKILISNIGPGGLRFISKLRLAANREVILRFQTDILEQTISVEGAVAWSKELPASLFEYGVEFIADESNRGLLTELLQRLDSIVAASRLPDAMTSGDIVARANGKRWSESGTGRAAKEASTTRDAYTADPGDCFEGAWMEREREVHSQDAAARETAISDESSAFALWGHQFHMGGIYEFFLANP